MSSHKPCTQRNVGDEADTKGKRDCKRQSLTITTEDFQMPSASSDTFTQYFLTLSSPVKYIHGQDLHSLTNGKRPYYQVKKSDMSGMKRVSPVWYYFKFNSGSSRSECIVNSVSVAQKTKGEISPNLKVRLQTDNLQWSGIKPGTNTCEAVMLNHAHIVAPTELQTIPANQHGASVAQKGGV